MSLSGGFGELRLGRTLNPLFYAAAAWELTGTANFSAVLNRFAGVLGDGPNTIRNSSQIAFTTPNLSGFSATVGCMLKGNNIVGGVAANPTTGAPAIAGVERAKVDLNAI